MPLFLYSSEQASAINIHPLFQRGASRILFRRKHNLKISHKIIAIGILLWYNLPNGEGFCMSKCVEFAEKVKKGISNETVVAQMEQKAC
jgi:hypothetical protein